MIESLLAGGVTGLGLFLLVRALFPPRPGLAARLLRLPVEGDARAVEHPAEDLPIVGHGALGEGCEQAVLLPAGQHALQRRFLPHHGRQRVDVGPQGR